MRQTSFDDLGRALSIAGAISLMTACSLSRPKTVNLAELSARARSFKTAPKIQNPAQHVPSTASNGWTITSYEGGTLCFEGTYTSRDRPVVEDLFDADVALWNDFDQPEESVRRMPAELSVLAKALPEDAQCDVDRYRGVGVPCRLFSARLRACAPHVPMDGGSGKYVRLTVAVAASTAGAGERRHAVWHVEQSP